MRKIILLTFVSIFSICSKAQDKEGFKTRYQSFLNGELTIFGNNILNRQTKQISANEDYGTSKQKILTNDNFSMEYIDIDKDNSTFSSSSASISIPKRAKIAFAGLYWAATYPFERGKSSGKRITAEDDNRYSVDSILLKLPKQKKYIPIKGDIIFDSKLKEDINYIKNMPYVAFADITSLVQELKSASGEYIVANVRGAQGYINGGSSAGWTILLVYEDSNVPMRKIEVQDGFLEVFNYEIPISFKNFKTPNNSETTARLAGAALESDAKEGENRIAIRKTPKEGIYMEADVRNADNFFNSTITHDEEHQTKRKPKNLNSLGFDIFINDIPNINNSFLQTGTTSLNVGTTSTEDTFYIFLMALCIDSDEVPIVVEEKIEEPKIEKKPIQEELPSSEIVKDNTNVEEQPKIEQPIVKEPVTPTPEKKPASTKEVTITGVKKGFYTIIGAFSKEEYANNAIANFNKKGLKADKFFFPDKKLYYIYLDMVPTYEEAMKKQIDFAKLKASKAELKSVKDPWILYIKN